MLNMKNIKISSETIARTVVLALALINQILAVAGKGTIDIAENDIYQLASLAATVVAALIAFWKNNSFTIKAIEADQYLKASKKSNLDPDDQENNIQ